MFTLYSMKVHTSLFTGHNHGGTMYFTCESLDMFFKMPWRVNSDAFEWHMDVVHIEYKCIHLMNTFVSLCHSIIDNYDLYNNTIIYYHLFSFC